MKYLEEGTAVVWGKRGELQDEGILLTSVSKCAYQDDGSKTFFASHHVGIPVETPYGTQYAHWVEEKPSNKD